MGHESRGKPLLSANKILMGKTALKAVNAPASLNEIMQGRQVSASILNHKEWKLFPLSI